MEQQNDYTAVPPPANLTGSSSEAAAAPVNFNDALSKARAIAEKLKQQQQQQAANGATGNAKHTSMLCSVLLIMALNKLDRNVAIKKHRITMIEADTHRQEVMNRMITTTIVNQNVACTKAAAVR